MAATLAIPLYSDEIAMGILRNTVAHRLSGITLYPQCTSQLDAPIPLALIPGALGSTLLFPSDSAWGIKMAGLAVGLAALLFMWLSLRVACRDSDWSTLLWVLTLGVTMLGVLPLLIAMARPEQMILLCLASLVLLSVTWQFRAPRRGFDWMGSIAVLGITSLLLYAHPKALFYLPVAFIAIMSVLHRRSLWVKVGLVVLTGAMGIESLRYTRQFVACPEDQFVSSLLKVQSLDLSSSPVGIVAELWQNLVGAPTSIAQHLTFQDVYQSSWLLAPAPLGPAGRAYASAVAFLIVAVLVLGTLGVAVAAVVQVVRSRQLASPMGLALAFAVGSIAHAAWYPRIHFYVGALLVPLAGFSLALALSRLDAADSLRRRFPAEVRIVTSMPVVMASIGVVMILVTYVPYALGVQRQGDTPALQSLSTPVIGMSQLHGDFVSARVKCGIPEAASSVAVDGAAFTQLEGLRTPIFIFYIDPAVYGGGIQGGLPLFLTRLGSDGAIALAPNFPAELAGRAVRVGDVMCVGPRGLAAMADE